MNQNSTPGDEEPVALLKNVSKKYKMGDTTITALNDVSYSFYKNELILVLGPSGSGKTTLLSILGSVIYPSSGTVEIKGQLVNKMKQKALADLRLHNIGFVFQYFNLIAPLNAVENVMQPLLLMGVSKQEARDKAEQALEKLNMGDRKKSLPRNLSGGQQQRVAIARALINDPSIILCDEPTASLEQASFESVMGRLKTLSKEGRCVIVVTHDHRLKAYADKIIYIENGEMADLPPDN
ncbi:ABC transporter ATP-binding protein [Saccharicrinis sp. FJH54]|uniref:ABC transporter ATP-binding protein n=1 Tax=Saccharicrinis sp. FJH54 TaxID=3344665 RepID=UPI0035D4AA3E